MFAEAINYCQLRGGGRLHQHLPETPGHESRGATAGDWSNHPVQIEESSLLASVIGTETMANSGHHQGVADAGSSWWLLELMMGLLKRSNFPELVFCFPCNGTQK